LAAGPLPAAIFREIVPMRDTIEQFRDAILAGRNSFSRPIISPSMLLIVTTSSAPSSPRCSVALKKLDLK
jgi:hypothetical protein